MQHCQVRVVLASVMAIVFCCLAPCNVILIGSALAESNDKQRSNIHKSLEVDKVTLKLINQGNWQQVVKRLEIVTEQERACGKADVWLAFAYMFLGKCNELKGFESKVASKSKEHSDETSRSLVLAFAQICEGKLAEAEKTVKNIVQGLDDDAEVNFVFACLEGKRGQAQSAIDYLNKTVELAPDFAWGYRTLGYLQERWMKDPASAEKAYEKALAIEPNCKEVQDMLVDLKLGHNDFDGAIAVAKHGIKTAPKEASNYFRLAQIYIQQWRLIEAIDELNKAIKLSPSDARFYRSMAAILRFQGQINQAIAKQQKACDLSQDKAFELAELANLNLIAGNRNRAAENLREALNLQPGNQSAFQRLVKILEEEKRFGELVEEYTKAVERQPKDIGLHVELARCLSLADKKSEAIKELKEAASLEPTNPQPHRELGKLLISEQNYGAAAKEYTRALNINPSSVEDLVALGYCYASNDDYLPAETALVTAIALEQLTGVSGPSVKPSYLSGAMRALAALFLSEGRYTEACIQLEAICASSSAAVADQLQLLQAKTLRDRSKTAILELVGQFDKLPALEKEKESYLLVDTLLTLGKSEQAKAKIDEIPTDKVNENNQWLLAKAKAYRLCGDLDKANEKVLQAIARKDPAQDVTCELYTELARIALAKGKLDDAESACQKAIELNPKSYAAYEVSGRIFLARGDSQKAIESAKRSLEIDPYYTYSYLLLGDAQGKSGQWQDACDSYKKACELYPDLVDAHKSLLKSYEKLRRKQDVERETVQILQIEKRQS